MFVMMTIPQQPIPVLNFIKQTIKPFRGLVLALIIINTLWALDLSFRPYVLKIVLDRVTQAPGNQVFNYALMPILLYLGLTLFNVILMRIYDYVSLRFVPALRLGVTADLTSYVMKHSYNYFQNNFAGSLANKISDVANGTRTLISIVIDRFYSNTLALIAACFTFATVSSVLSIIFLIWVMFFVIFTYVVTRKIHRLSYQVSEVRSVLIGRIVDLLVNNMTVRLFARGSFEQDYLNKHAHEGVRQERTLRWYMLKVNAIQGLSFIIMLSSCLCFLLWARQRGQVTVGDFALILSVCITLMELLWGLSRDFSEFTEEWGRVSQGLTITSIPHEIIDAVGATPLTVTAGKITFENVHFWYKGTTPLFDSLSVTIEPGQKVGLIGFSGSGKTTFINLILRLYDIQRGSITIDDQNISKVTAESLHKQIATIPQEPLMLNRTIADNIRYGRLEAPDSEVIEAAKKANAHEFIEQMTFGYFTEVGERGSLLSGGQRQRIAIARAILKDAPILIMDEATSALDSISEKIIQSALDQLMRNRTTLVIAHRLSTLKTMDRLLVFEKGKIVEDGTHKELLHTGGLYSRLWQSQVNGFIQNV